MLVPSHHDDLSVRRDRDHHSESRQHDAVKVREYTPRGKLDLLLIQFKPGCPLEKRLP
jgi:hypothetical protein